MKLAVEEHLKSTEYPKVGVVIANSGNILATGYRGERSRVHSERVAIEKLDSEQLSGSTIFSTLEPCVGIHEDQGITSCADLIIDSGLTEAVIGVLDPNASIYSQGYRKLLENNISVSFFNRKLRVAVEEETFEYGHVDKIKGTGRRRIPVPDSGINIEVQFSENDDRKFNIRWASLQPNHGLVHLVSRSGAVRVASGARNFGDITDPLVFRFPSHFVKMKKGTIA